MESEQSDPRVDDTMEPPLAGGRALKDKLHEILEATLAEKNAPKEARALRGIDRCPPRRGFGPEVRPEILPPEAKARMQEMVRNLLAAMRDDILTRPWMSDDTKEKAMAKIATFNPKIGYPDKWKDYSHVDIRRDAFFEDMIAGNASLWSRTTVRRLASRFTVAVGHDASDLGRLLQPDDE